MINMAPYALSCVFADLPEDEHHDMFYDRPTPVEWKCKEWIPGTNCRRYLTPHEAFELYVPLLCQIQEPLLETQAQLFVRNNAECFPRNYEYSGIRDLTDKLSICRNQCVQNAFLQICYPLTHGLRNAILEVILSLECENAYELAYRAFDLDVNLKYRKFLPSPLFAHLLDLRSKLPNVDNAARCVRRCEIEKPDFHNPTYFSVCGLYPDGANNPLSMPTLVNYMYSYEKQEELGRLVTTTFLHTEHVKLIPEEIAFYMLKSNTYFTAWVPGFNHRFEIPFPNLLSFVEFFVKTQLRNPKPRCASCKVNLRHAEKIKETIDEGSGYESKRERMRVALLAYPAFVKYARSAISYADPHNSYQLLFELCDLLGEPVDELENPLEEALRQLRTNTSLRSSLLPTLAELHVRKHPDKPQCAEMDFFDYLREVKNYSEMESLGRTVERELVAACYFLKFPSVGRLTENTARRLETLENPLCVFLDVPGVE